MALSETVGLGFTRTVDEALCASESESLLDSFDTVEVGRFVEVFVSVGEGTSVAVEE